MKLAVCGAGAERFVALVVDDHVVPVRAPSGMHPHDAVIEIAMGRMGAEPAGDPRPCDGVRFLPPVRPASIRDFYAFEAHVRTARRSRGLDMEPDWYELPVFYFTNPHRVYGHDDTVPYPSSTAELDYELEFAWVMGDSGSDLTPSEAVSMIAGFTVFNDLSARDVQRREMRMSLGPAKGKDFANVLGPWLVTPDEMGGDPSRPRGAMTARVNGEEWSRADAGELHHAIGDMIAYASRDSSVARGDVMGSGTCGTGCILELRASDPDRRWIAPGDVVELEVEGIGALRTRIGPPGSGGNAPISRHG